MIGKRHASAIGVASAGRPSLSESCFGFMQDDLQHEPPANKAAVHTADVHFDGASSSTFTHVRPKATPWVPAGPSVRFTPACPLASLNWTSRCRRYQVRSLYTESRARKSVAHLAAPSRFALRCERQQESVHQAEGRRRRAELQRTSRSLGRPSVGGRLTTGGARNEYKEEFVIRPSRFGRVASNAVSNASSRCLVCRASGGGAVTYGRCFFCR